MDTKDSNVEPRLGLGFKVSAIILGNGKQTPYSCFCRRKGVSYRRLDYFERTKITGGVLFAFTITVKTNSLFTLTVICYVLSSIINEVVV